MAGSDVVISLPPGALHTSWNQSGNRLAAAFSSGSIQVWDQDQGGSLACFCSSEWKAHESVVVKVVWAPLECGDVIASCSNDGSVCVWEEISQGDGLSSWRLCAHLKEGHAPVLDLQFGNCRSGLKLVVAAADGQVKVYETTDSLELKQWQLQADVPAESSVADLHEKFPYSGASVSWRPSVSSIQQLYFVLGYRAKNASSRCIAKIWEFVELQQRWHPIAELLDSDEEPEAINHIAWAPNSGRPYDLVAVATRTAVSIWQICFSPRKSSVKRVARLKDHRGEVWEAVWDMSGMTLAISACDGSVTLWQCNVDSTWQRKGVVEGSENELQKACISWITVTN